VRAVKTLPSPLASAMSSPQLGVQTINRSAIYTYDWIKLPEILFKELINITYNFRLNLRGSFGLWIDSVTLPYVPIKV
jgi:hypothetical protein